MRDCPYLTTEVHIMQHEKRKPFQNFFKGKGYYISLFVCLLAVGITGLIFYRHEEVPKVPDESSSVETSAVEPTVTPTRPQQSTTPSKPAISQQTVTDSKLMEVMAPLQGTMLHGYAMEELSYNDTTRDWRTHDGIDIAAATGTQVAAAADGVVYAVYDDESLGKTVVIHHDGGYSTYYSNLTDEVNVRAGDTVDAGDIIGKVGESAMTELATDPHLHFSVCKNDKPIDPSDFLNHE